MKTMKTLWYFVLVLCASSIAGATMTVVTTGDWGQPCNYDGTVYVNNGTGGNGALWGLNSGIAYIGNDSGGYEDNFTVVKFGLSSLPSGETVGDVQFTAWLHNFADSDTHYFKIWHYTYDNSSAVSGSDYDFAHLEGGQVVAYTESYGGGVYCDFDVTNFVASDVAKGNTYSSFFIEMVNSDGTAFTPANSPGVDFVLMTTTEGAWGVGSTPQLDVTTTPTPEPATMALLMLGGAFVWKKKA